MRAQRSGGRHETKWNSAITLERQDIGANPLAERAGQKPYMDPDAGIIRRVLNGRRR
jgi:hypothetical protein